METNLQILSMLLSEVSMKTQGGHNETVKKIVTDNVANLYLMKTLPESQEREDSIKELKDCTAHLMISHCTQNEKLDSFFKMLMLI